MVTMEWSERKEVTASQLLNRFYDCGLVMTWYGHKPDGWTLRSGVWSPYYINLRPLSSHPSLLREVGNAVADMMINEAEYCQNSTYGLVGVAQAGVPIAISAGIGREIPALWTRKIDAKSPEDVIEGIKAYGHHTMVEGVMHDGSRLAVVDDLVTDFGSKLVAVEQVKAEASERDLNVTCEDVGVVLDREQGAAEAAREHGMNLYSLIPFKSRGMDLLGDRLHPVEREHLIGYMDDPVRYQNDPELRRHLIELAKNR